MLLFREVAYMQIEKNIAATLRSEMERQGKTLMEFSTELGIPRSTLQGYLKGTSHPRADSMEELAYKLGISLADLVSGGTAANMRAAWMRSFWRPRLCTPAQCRW
ncbi:helix-turn-helix domain-containing protein [uncultured Dysosmobacter sp.]|uniref:helix-turn-helix domain-containing protein n=1 Tax=uncultured Dysosmobacter sp. TaxID=2591384 RepID=UPI00345C9F7B